MHAPNEQLNPTQQASLAKKLVESDKVVGIVGNTSFTECGTNWKYYKSKGFTVIGAGVQAECFGTPTFVESNMGPRDSNIGAAQALVRRGAKSLIVASPDTISAYADGGVLKVAKAAGIKGQAFPIKNCPITNTNSTIWRFVQAAGDGGGVILDFSRFGARASCRRAMGRPGRQGAVGLFDPDRQRVHGEAVPAVRRQDAHQPGVRQHGDGTADENLYLAITKSARRASRPASPDGFGMDAKFATQALLSIKGDVTAASYNKAVRALKHVKRHALQAVVRRREARVPHPEQHRHHGHLQGWQDRDRGQVHSHPGS